MSIYIISNRPVEQDENGNEVFSSNSKAAALTNFRIAECTISNQTLTYELKKDLTETEYDKVIKVVNGELSKDLLVGTENMFHDLYAAMKSGGKVKSDVMFFMQGNQSNHDEEKEHIIKLNDLYLHQSSDVKHLIYMSWLQNARY